MSIAYVWKCALTPSGRSGPVPESDRRCVWHVAFVAPTLLRELAQQEREERKRQAGWVSEPWTLKIDGRVVDAMWWGPKE